MKIKACIFDLDGVIVDTAKYHYLAWRRLARELGFDFSPRQNERLKGVSRMRSLEILLEEGGLTLSNNEMENAARRKNTWYVDFISTITPDEILPGVPGFLREVRSSGVKSAIGSASKNAGIILDRLQIKELFDVVIDGTQVTKAKPDPEIFLVSAIALHCKPGECLVFEDARAGIEAAKNGGMACVGVGDGNILKQADLIISSFDNLRWNDVLKKLDH